MRKYKELINKHNGETAFVLGAGTSLYDIYQDLHFQNIFKDVVISVNSSIMVTSWDTPDNDKRYWISNDSLCRRWSWWKDVKKAQCTKVVRDSWLKYKDELKDFLFFSPRPTSEDIVNPDDEGLCYCCSVASGIDLAIQMGCSRIFVWGLDHDAPSGYHHFWQLFDKKYQPRQIKPAQGPWTQQKSVFPIHLKSYNALLKFAELRGVKIYNCSPLSKVNIFEKINSDWMWKIINESK